MKPSLLQTSIAVVAGLGLSASVQALELHDSFANDQQTTEINQTGSLIRFDPSLGTLTSVTLRVTGDSTTDISLTNNGANTENVSADGTVNFFFTNNITVPNPPTFNTSMATGFQAIASGDTFVSGAITDSAFSETDYTSASDLASFTGLSSFDIGCTTVSGLGLTGGGGNVAATQASTAGCSAEVWYTYNPPSQAPAPTSLALMGLALAGLGSVRRRKASVKA